jgi:hypothetical protein
MRKQLLMENSSKHTVVRQGTIPPVRTYYYHVDNVCESADEIWKGRGRGGILSVKLILEMQCYFQYSVQSVHPYFLYIYQPPLTM